MTNPTELRTARQEALASLYEMGAHLFAFHVDRDPNDPTKKTYRFDPGWQLERSALAAVLEAEHVGFIAGKIGVSVVDVDVKDGGDAFARKTLGDERSAACLDYFGDTPCIVRTPTDGVHLFYQRAEPHPKLHVEVPGAGKTEVFGDTGFVELYDPETVVRHLPLLPVIEKLAGASEGPQDGTSTPASSTPTGHRNNDLYAAVLAAVSNDPDPAASVEAAVKRGLEAGLGRREVDRTMASAIAAGSGNRHLPIGSMKPDPNKPVTNHKELAESFHARGLADDLRWVDDLEQWRRFEGDRWIDIGAPAVIYPLMQLGQAVLGRFRGDPPVFCRTPERGGSTPFATNAQVALKDLCSTRLEDWDQPWKWVGAPGGKMLNLKDGSIRDMVAADLTTKCIGALPGETGSEVVERFLIDCIPNTDEREYLLRRLATALEGSAAALQECLVLLGPPAAGKSLLLELVSDLFLDYAGDIPPELVCKSREPASVFHRTSIIGGLAGKRFVRVGDPEPGTYFNPGTYEQLTGDATLTGRIGNRTFQVQRNFLLAMGANHLPGTRSNSAVRRTAVIHFPRHHTDREDDGFPQVDRELIGKLRRGLPYLLLKLLDHAGLPIDIPKPSETYEVMRVETKAASFARFESECLVRKTDELTLKQFVFDAYNRWREAAPPPKTRPRLTNAEIGKRMSERGFPGVRRNTPEGQRRYFTNVRLR